MSSSDLASAAEEALYSCYIIELAQALLKLAERGEFMGFLAILINSPSVRSALDEKFIRLIEFAVRQIGMPKCVIEYSNFTILANFM